jgi:hypothetical protein
MWRFISGDGDRPLLAAAFEVGASSLEWHCIVEQGIPNLCTFAREFVVVSRFAYKFFIRSQL